MTRISELLADGPSYSFEFGPPRTDEAEQRLAKTLVELEPLGPSFVSVTYGALGTTRDMKMRRRPHSFASWWARTAPASEHSSVSASAR